METDAVERCAVPTIAAIAGFCTGGGAAIAAVCDLRLATDELPWTELQDFIEGACLHFAERWFLMAPVQDGTALPVAARN